MALSQVEERFTQRVSNFFKVEERGSTWANEFRGGLVTFLTLVYIIPVNSSLLSNTGGACNCGPNDGAGLCRFSDMFEGNEAYLVCLDNVRRQLITANALACFLGTFMMGMFANLPFALAPSVGLTGYLAFAVIGYRSTGDFEWGESHVAVFMAGVLFLAITLLGLRGKMTSCIPLPLKHAFVGGIGLYLALLGLMPEEGLGIVVMDIDNGLSLGGCVPENRNLFNVCNYRDFNETDWIIVSGVIWYSGEVVEEGQPTVPVVSACQTRPSAAYTCDTYQGKMQASTTWIGLFGMVAATVMLKKKVPGAIIIPILVISVLSWYEGTPISYFNDENEPDGGERYQYFRQIAKFEPIDQVAGNFLWSDAFEIEGFWGPVAIFLYTDLMESTGSLFGLSEYADLLDAEGDFEGSYKAFVVDAMATIFSAVLGVAPATTAIESSVGLREGAKTGFASVITSFLFLACAAFAPVLSSIPPWATGGALVIIGANMMKKLTLIDWDNPEVAVPCFLTIVLIPLTTSILNGVVGGIAFYAVTQGVIKLTDKCTCFAGCCGPRKSQISDKFLPDKKETDTTDESENVAPVKPVEGDKATL